MFLFYLNCISYFRKKDDEHWEAVRGWSGQQASPPQAHQCAQNIQQVALQGKQLKKEVSVQFFNTN